MTPPDTNLSERLLYDARCVDDIARLQLNVGKDTAANWIIIKLHPAPHSGAATSPGKMIDGSTGEVVDRPDSTVPGARRVTVVVEGEWEFVDSLTGGAAPAARGSYSWTKPLPVRLHQLSGSDLYSPFEKGGVVLCRYDSTREADRQFDPVLLLPPNWQSAVHPAYEWFTSLGTIFRPGDPAALNKALGPVVLGDNPIVGIVAFRFLAESASVSPDLFAAAFRKGDHYFRAVLIYILLVTDKTAANETLVGELEHRFDSATMDEQRAAAAAIFARMVLNQAVAPAGMQESRLLEALRSRSPAYDPYLREVFHALGK